jgi:hypothetical protein
MLEWVGKASETDTQDMGRSQCDRQLHQQHDAHDTNFIAMLHQNLVLKFFQWFEDTSVNYDDYNFDDSDVRVVAAASAPFNSADRPSPSSESNDDDNNKTKECQNGMNVRNGFWISLTTFAIVDLMVALFLVALAGTLLFVPLVFVLVRKLYLAMSALLSSRSIQWIRDAIFGCYNQIQWMLEFFQQQISSHISGSDILEEEITFEPSVFPITLTIDQANEMLFRAMYDNAYYEVPSKSLCVSLVDQLYHEVVSSFTFIRRMVISIQSFIVVTLEIFLRLLCFTY